jgi:hypothetical protein
MPRSPIFWLESLSPCVRRTLRISRGASSRRRLHALVSCFVRHQDSIGRIRSPGLISLAARESPPSARNQDSPRGSTELFRCGRGIVREQAQSAPFEARASLTTRRAVAQAPRLDRARFQETNGCGFAARWARPTRTARPFNPCAGRLDLHDLGDDMGVVAKVEHGKVHVCLRRHVSLCG